MNDLRRIALNTHADALGNAVNSLFDKAGETIKMLLASVGTAREDAAELIAHNEAHAAAAVLAQAARRIARKLGGCDSCFGRWPEEEREARVAAEVCNRAFERLGFESSGIVSFHETAEEAKAAAEAASANPQDCDAPAGCRYRAWTRQMTTPDGVMKRCEDCGLYWLDSSEGAGS